MKTCSRCGQFKQDSEFNSNSSKKTGSQSWCRECTTEYNRRWYEANREKHREYVRAHDKRPKKVHLCKKCERGEPEVEFYIKKVGNRFYRRFLCRACESEYRSKYARGERKPRSNTERAFRESVRRSDERNRARYVIKDSKRSDRRKGLDNDLDVPFVEMLLFRCCAYCGESGIMMTLDRIDNSKGHLKDNVVQACYRCNHFRGNMPYQAWMMVVPGLKRARKKGLLEGWSCGAQKKAYASVAQEEEQRPFKSRDEASRTSACTMAP